MSCGACANRCEQTAEEIDAMLHTAEVAPVGGGHGGHVVGYSARNPQDVHDSEIDSHIDALHDEHPSLFEDD